jgi:nitrite reductase/ring-hydroxylating ferredoxin subunit
MGARGGKEGRGGERRDPGPCGEFRATDNICTHEYAQLHEGWLEDGCIECPLHAARFDIRSGKALCAPADVDLAVFEVKAEGEDLLIKV